VVELPFRGFLALNGKVAIMEQLFVSAVNGHGKKGIFLSDLKRQPIDVSEQTHAPVRYGLT
jgi:hypothetical protein